LSMQRQKYPIHKRPLLSAASAEILRSLKTAVPAGSTCCQPNEWGFMRYRPLRATANIESPERNNWRTPINSDTGLTLGFGLRPSKGIDITLWSSEPT